MVKIIKVNGSVVELKPTGDSKSVRKRDIAIAIGGTPRIVELSMDSILIIRDDQNNDKLRKNNSASSIFTGSLKRINGDVLYGKQNEFEF